MLRTGVAVAAFLVSATLTFAAELGYYSQPALWGDRLVFVSEGDLWTLTIPDTAGESANTTPLVAHRLTSSDGDESRPCISPDGQLIAFSAQYEGNTDVYVMPIDGGMPRRMTFHPAPDIALGWLPDGQSIVFASPRIQQFGRPELWRVPVAGGMPVRYEFGECSMISFSATGKRIAFTRWSNETWTWKRYRGGTAPDVWIGDLAAGTFSQLTNDPASDLFPMWLNDRVYFLSDRTDTANIFSDSPNDPGKDIKQHTHFAPDATKPTAVEGYDVRWPSADARRGGKRIAFCQAGGLALLDTANDSVRRLEVRLASDRVAARQRFAPLNETITEFDLSPDGKKLLIGSRGEIMTIPIEHGAAQQITHTSNVREWGAQYLGKDRIVMISDQTGEQQIAIAPADGSSAPALLTQDREAWLFPPESSPDGRYVAFGDKTLRLHLLDTQTLEKRFVDQSEAGEITDYRFSPDSQWLAYTKPMPNGFGEVHIFSIRTGRSFPISGPLCNDSQPRWDPAGKYLYFLSQRNLNPTMGPLDFEHVLIDTTEVWVLPLSSDTPPPFKAAAEAVGFDLEEWASPPDKDDDAAKKDEGAGKDDAKDKDKDKGKKKKPADEVAAEAPANPNAPPPNAIRVDTDGLPSRQYKLAIDAGTYSNLEALWGAVTYIDTPVPGLLDDQWPEPSAPEGALHRFDLLKEGDKADKTLAEKIGDYAINDERNVIAYPELGEGEKIVGFKVISASGEGDPKKVDIKSQKLRITIQQEWGQILAEAWRLQRDFFWAPNYVGVNWPAMKTKYEALLPRIGTRGELNDLVGQLIGELGNSHTYVFGGEQFNPIKPVKTGLLGADIESDGRGFKIARIVPGQPWGDDKLVSPLEASYLNVKPGNYIIAVNGIPASSTPDLYELLQDLADKRIHLTIADDAAGTNKRTIEIKTLSNETPLRLAAWVEANRKYVDDKSNGKLGYIYLPDMGGEGLSYFSRLYYPQYTKQGLVIDIRDNGGGFVSQMIISRLSRKVWAFDQPRQGMMERYPQRTLYGYSDVIIDEHAGSDGDIFPESFRMLNLGPLIGTRTWGGVVGIRGDKPFVDMGLSTQPEFAWWEPKGGWTVENVGVAPDIEVVITPADRVAGRDTQLDKAIEVLMQKLKDQPMELPKPPPWPVRVGSKK